MKDKIEVTISERKELREIEHYARRDGRWIPEPVLRPNEEVHHTIHGPVIIQHEAPRPDPLFELLTEYEVLREDYESNSQTGMPFPEERLERLKHLRNIIESLHD